MEDIEMNDLLVTEATKPNRREFVKQSERRSWKLTLGSVLCVLLTLCAVGLICWAINNRIQAHPDVDTGNNRTIRQSMCETFEPGCKPDPEPSDPEPSDPEPSDPEPSDPEPSGPESSDPGSSDTGSPDGSSCEMFEEDCPYNNPPSDTNQPEVTEDKKGTGTMEPLSNKSKKSVFLKWMNVTYPWLSPRQFLWQNESAAQPAVVQTNWLMACHILANTSPTLWLMSLEEKRVYAYWAEWVVVQTAEEFADFWMKDPNYPREFAIVKRQLYLLQRELSNN